MYRSNTLRFGIIAILTLIVSAWGVTGSAADAKSKATHKPTPTASNQQSAKDSLVKAADSLKVPTSQAHRVVAYYFHGNQRCVTCRKLEAYTAEAIDSAFGNQLKAGTLEWHVVNTDSTGNEHFVQDYQLYTKAVILSAVDEGKQTRWKNLDKIWELVGDRDKFHTYIQNEVRMFIDSTK